MCEVTCHNFEQNFSKIVSDLRSAAFICFDCEFTGLFETDEKYSLFDTPPEVFDKLQKSLSNYSIIQFGLSVFETDRETSGFNVTSYSFSLLPPTLYKKFSKFSWQLGSIDFLCRHNFDFNKTFYDGISYLSRAEEKQALKMIDDGSIYDNLTEIDAEEYYTKIDNWVSTAPEGGEYFLTLENERPTFILTLHSQIRKKFPNVWTYFTEGNTIRLEKISKQSKTKLSANKQEEAIIKKKMYDSLMGFSKIIYEIELLKKPIVGHNLIIDLIMIYRHFYNSSYLSYAKFKKNIHKIFPCLYDTKVLSINLLMKVGKENCWECNSLSSLYSYFTEGKGTMQILLPPLIKSNNKEFLEANNFHDAAYDSYCTGFCFVRLAYMNLLWDEEKRKFLLSPVSRTTASLLGAILPMKNHLHLGRSHLKYIRLDGPDEQRRPPQIIYIESATNQPLNVKQLSEKFSKYNSLDIKLVDEYRGQMAISNPVHAKRILQTISESPEYQITKFARLKHSFWGRTIARGLLFLCRLFTGQFS